MNKPAAPAAAHLTNFIRNAIDADLAAGKYASRTWGGRPGLAARHAGAPPDPAKIRTRFPPEPNGYLHFGHAKSICLNFGLARDYGGVCHLRFDDTNPEKEEQEYVDAILDAVRWLGFDWSANGTEHLYYASDYFDSMYQAAEYLITSGHAYVDEQSADEMRATRGTLTEHGQDSPYRDRPAAENLARLREMRAGKHADGSMVLRAQDRHELRPTSTCATRRSTASSARRTTTPATRGASIRCTPTRTRSRTRWSTSPIRSAPWSSRTSARSTTGCSTRLAEGGLLARPLPQQIEFARLNLTYVVLSKRKLIQLVERRTCRRLGRPAHADAGAARRRGFTPEGFRLFAERIGVSKADSWIDYGVLEECMREDLNAVAPRRIAVLDPLKLVIDNYPEGATEECLAPNHPQQPELGKRALPFSRELWIEREDFMEVPAKGYFRLYPGNKVRLRYGFVVECTGCDKDAAGKVTRRALQLLRRQQVGHARCGQLQGQGQHPLGLGQARLPVRGAALRPPVPRSASGHRATRDFLLDLNPDGEDGHQRAARARAEGRKIGGALPVRAARLLRRRPHRLEARRARVQPRGDLEGHLAEVKT